MTAGPRPRGLHPFPRPGCIDYCLFLLTRHRQSLMDGLDPVSAAGMAAATSGRAVHVSGSTVVIALSGQEDHGTWHRYAHRVERRPWWFLAGGVVTLAVLAIPLFFIQLGHIGDGADPKSFTDRRAYDLMSSAFGASR